MKTLLLAALALGLAALPAAAQAQDRHGTGDALRYTPSGVPGCEVSVMETSTGNGHVMVWLRNGGSRPVQFTLGGQLEGGGRRSIGTVSTAIGAGRNVQVRLMLLLQGSLAGTTLTLRGTSCTLGA